MNSLQLLQTPEPQLLDQISTHWTQLQEPVKVLLRYGTAIQQYLNALLTDSHVAEEVSQTFLLSVLQRGFPEADPNRGRFRDYLKICVRNAALDYLRQERPMVHGDLTWLETSGQTDDHGWLDQWRACLLERTWRALEHYEQQSRGSLAFTVLQIVGSHPDDVAHMRRTADRLFGDAYQWSVLAAGARQLPVAAMAASMNGHVRVGLEDSLWGGPGKLAASNAEQVRMIRQVISGLGLEAADPDEARAILGLKGGSNVGF